MKRVVITGLGIISCIGNDKTSVTTALQQGRSGIAFQPVYQKLGMRSQIAGSINLGDKASQVDRKIRRFMGPSALYAYLAMQQSVADARLTPELVSHPATGLIAGSGGASPSMQVEAADIMRNKGVKYVGSCKVPQAMASTVSACLSVAFKIKGISFSISSACSTSLHCMITAAEQIQHGKQNIVFAGGAEEEGWETSGLFDALGALSTRYNDQPHKASRAYDKDRDGFVIAGGGAMVVVEELEHALQRKAPIYAEITGFGATSDGHDMVLPSGEGAQRCMQMALHMADRPRIDYINAHGTSTPKGDMIELEAIRAVFPGQSPAISATKSLTGHSLGAVGAQEVIFSLLMMQHHFIAASANIDQLDDQARDMDIVQTTRYQKRLDHILSNSFGFGGANACMLLSRWSQQPSA